MRFLTLLVFVCVISVSMCCTCLRSDLKRQFCSADFALEIKVSTERQTTEEPHEVWFGTNVTQIFKADDRMKIAIISGKIYTSDSSAGCGRNLNNGETYIVTGSFYNGKLRINLCGFGANVNLLTPELKQFFDKDYKTVVCEK